jgi:ribosome-associated heat shock protein Hsp15
MGGDPRAAAEVRQLRAPESAGKPRPSRYDAVAVPRDDDEKISSVRLDKWLWAARFFKTRSLAAQAIAAGHVKAAGVRAKAAHLLKEGEELSLQIGPTHFTICVRALSGVRRGAPEARLLYEETPESMAAREEQAAMRRAERDAFTPALARPSKRDRRAIDRLRGR